MSVILVDNYLNALQLFRVVDKGRFGTGEMETKQGNNGKVLQNTKVFCIKKFKRNYRESKNIEINASSAIENRKSGR